MRRNSVFLAAIGISILYCYAFVLLELMKKWGYDDSYSYGFLIPIISVYLVWEKRNEIRRMPMAPDFMTGIPVLFSGLVMLIIGKFSTVLLVQQFSIVPTIIGIILILYGRSIFQKVWFPILYLIFMIPLWNFFLDPFHPTFQLFSASIGVKILNAIGVPVLQNNTFIELSNITLEVAEVCSGINYLVSVVAISLPLCYLFLNSWLKRCVLICLSALIAIGSNGLRVAAIALYSYGQGDRIVVSEIHGPFAIFRAIGIAMIGYMVLFLGVWYLSEKRNFPKRIFSEVEPASNTDASIENNNTHVRTNCFFPLVSVLMIVSSGTYINFYKPVPVPLKMNFSHFPKMVEGWVGKDIDPVDDLVDFNLSGVTNELSKIYKNESGEEVLLYIGYFDYQSQGKELINYKLDHLIANSTPLEMDFGNYDLNAVNIYRKRGSTIVLYWFDINGRKTNNQYLAKAHLTWNSMMERKSNSAIIMVRTNTKRNDDPQESILLCKKFLDIIFPIIPEFLPANN